MNNEIIKFVNGDLQLDVTVTPDNETVWLNRNQLAQLFGRDVKTIGKHINNALKEELSNEVVVANLRQPLNTVLSMEKHKLTWLNTIIWI